MTATNGSRNPTWWQLRATVAAHSRAQGMRSLADILEDPPFEVYGQRLDSMLTWVSQVGSMMAAKILETCQSVPYDVPVGELGQRERRIVAGRLRGTAREIERGI